MVKFYNDSVIDSYSDWEWYQMTSRRFQMDPKISKYYKCLNKCNVFKYLWKPSKLTKNQDSLLSSIMNSCMNIWRVRMKFRYFCILLGRGFSSMVFIERIMSNFNQKLKTTQWRIQLRKFAGIKNIRDHFCLP